MVKSDVEGVQALMGAMEGVPNFVGKIVNQYLTTQEAMMSEGYDLKTKVPQFFSETKFANHVSKVYEVFL